MTPHRGTDLALDLAVLELKLYAFTEALRRIAPLERRYNPDQPRVSAGNPDGGQRTGSGGSQGGRSGGSSGGKPTQVALAGKLERVQLLHMERTYFWMCHYRDMLGRPWGYSLKLDKLCPDTSVAPPVKGQ